MPRKDPKTIKRGRTHDDPEQNATRPKNPKRSRTQSFRPSKVAVSMPRLPNEIIMIIAEFLEAGHVGNFRLCCRDFSTIGLPHLLRRVVVFRYLENLGWLQMLSENPALSQHVRSLHFEIDVLKERAVPFQRYVQDVELFRLYAATSKSHSMLKSAVYNQPLTRNRLRESYNKYEMAINFQREYIRNISIDIPLWFNALRSMHNLNAVTIASGFHYRTVAFPEDPHLPHNLYGFEKATNHVGKRSSKCF
jgi:hypothetical protein